jgi:hypothetical protein
MSETKKYILVGFAAIIFILFMSAAGVAFGIITLPWHSVNAQVQAGHDVIDKTYTADNAVTNYEWFKQTYADIQATQNKIQNTQDQMTQFTSLNGNNTSQWDYQTKQTYEQLQTTFMGQKSYYEDLVAQYNARSQMADRNIFKDQLPVHVDSTLEKTKL